MTRQFFVGGNFKMNPATREAKRALIQTLNEATLDPNTGEQNVPRTPASRPDDLTIPFHSIPEVVIAPPALYLITVIDLLRKDVKVAAQNCHAKTSGAFTGEIRWGSPDRPISPQI